MASDGNDDIIGSIQRQLSRTHCACASLLPIPGVRPGNLVYRGVLSQPLAIDGDNQASSVIIKRTTESRAKGFEELLLNSLANHSDDALSVSVKSPHLLLYDHDSGMQVLEDFCDTVGLKPMLYSANIHSLLPTPSRNLVGQHLGRWLRSFHDWASAPEQAALQAIMSQNDAMRQVKYSYTYEFILEVLDQYPELVRGHRSALEAIQNRAAKETQKPAMHIGDGYGLIHGDFWSGNILISSTGWHEPSQATKPNGLFIIDWEFAQFGHRAFDLGQIVGDLLEQKVCKDLETVIDTMNGVIEGYGALDDEMAFRTAIHVGVHLISWDKRRPRKGPRAASPEVVLACLTMGRDFVVKGWEKDRAFFGSSILGPLFA